jgi:hypothetical protein
MKDLESGDRKEKDSNRGRDVGSFSDGRDEMNLVEFPLSSVSNRYLDGRKTVVLDDQVWDRDRREHVARQLAISGSDRYGLPTAKDEDVLLAAIQLSRLGEFQRREVRFSRYELLKLLRWPDESKYYRRLSTSLRRWKGLTIYSNRAFYDHTRKSWVNRDFGIFDNLFIYEREQQEGASAPASSYSPSRCQLHCKQCNETPEIRFICNYYMESSRVRGSTSSGMRSFLRAFSRGI